MFDLTGKRVVGGAHLRLTLRPAGSSRLVDAIAFNRPGESLSAGSRLRLVYRLEVNEFRGASGMQLNVQYIEHP
jgi:single-stranded-DNA-specific exonuclease